MNDLAKNLLLWVVIAVVLMAVFQSFTPRAGGNEAVSYDRFIQQVENGEIAKAIRGEDRVTIHVERKDGSRFTTFDPGDAYFVSDMIKYGVETRGTPPSGPGLGTVLLSILPYIIFIGIFIFFMRQLQAGSGGRGAMSFGRSRAKLQGEDQVKITFADVAGCDEAKEEVSELVEFLRDPGKFQKLGGHMRQGHRRRGQGAVLLDLGLRFRRDVRRCGRLPRARYVRPGQEARALHHLHRRDRRRRAPPRRRLGRRP